MRPSLAAYALAAVFLIVAAVDLAIRPVHYERTLVVAIVVAVACGAYGRRRSSSGPA